jgi:hypothetical protein
VIASQPGNDGEVFRNGILILGGCLLLLGGLIWWRTRAG